MAKSLNKIGLQFSGFDEMIAKLDELQGDLKKTTEKALKASFDYVTPKLHEDMKKHRKTGETEDSIVDDARVNWEGSTASINVGFDIMSGGLPSIFLMYGTPRHAPNHPGTNADKKLYNDIFGPKTKKEIAEIQREIFAAEIKKKMEG